MYKVNVSGYDEDDDESKENTTTIYEFLNVWNELALDDDGGEATQAFNSVTLADAHRAHGARSTLEALSQVSDSHSGRRRHAPAGAKSNIWECANINFTPSSRITTSKKHYDVH